LAKHLRKNGPATTTAFAVGAAPSLELENMLAVARRARDERKKLDISYCGPAKEPARRTVHVHQIVEAAGRWYVIAWCEKMQDFRRFRAERILEARLLEQDFRPQVLFKPVKKLGELLTADETVPARVAFSERIARWLKERYPGGREQADGRYVVTFKVADPGWFVREVLQYGAEAEVLGPEGLRGVVKRLVE
jgi:predicted DNA-binding transcriptional regulator YafY